MKIGIMGTPVSSGNRGVLALGASLVHLCFQADPEARPFLLLVGRRKEPVAYRVGGKVIEIPVVSARLAPRGPVTEHLGWILLMSLVYRMVPVRAVRAGLERSTPWIAAVAQADVVGDIRGGDSFSDIYGLKWFTMGCLPSLSVILIRRRVVHFPQTCGPFKNRLAAALGRFLLRRSDPLLARDLKSQQVAQEMVGPAHPVVLCPDVAFSLEAVRPEAIEVDPPLDGPPAGDIIGLNVNGLMYNGGFTRSNMFGLKLDYPAFLRALVPALLAEHPGELWLIPHTFAPPHSVESDPEASRQLRASLPADLQARVRLVTRAYDQHEIKGVIGGCSFFIGSRMHACIAALSQGIPAVGVAYSRKFQGVFESVGVQDWVIDGRDTETQAAIEKILELYRAKHLAAAPLAHRCTQARRRLADVFAQLVTASPPPAPSPISAPPPSEESLARP